MRLRQYCDERLKNAKLRMEQVHRNAEGEKKEDTVLSL